MLALIDIVVLKRKLKNSVDSKILSAFIDEAMLSSIDTKELKGYNIWFAEEPHKKWNIKACDERYLICTRPYLKMKTVYYTIVDLKTQKRSCNDFVFNIYNYSTLKDIKKCLADLNSGECSLSRRNQIDVDIIKLKPNK